MKCLGNTDLIQGISLCFEVSPLFGSTGESWVSQESFSPQDASGQHHRLLLLPSRKPSPPAGPFTAWVQGPSVNIAHPWVCTELTVLQISAQIPIVSCMPSQALPGRAAGR